MEVDLKSLAWLMGRYHPAKLLIVQQWSSRKILVLLRAEDTYCPTNGEDLPDCEIEDYLFKGVI